jgi:hypothetical protein
MYSASLEYPFNDIFHEMTIEPFFANSSAIVGKKPQFLDPLKP